MSKGKWAGVVFGSPLKIADKRGEKNVKKKKI